jgi:hydrogenase maturation protease
MGNPVLGDDAIGIVLATALKRQLAGLPGVDVVEECYVGGLELLDVLEGYDRLIALDSVATAGAAPGTWYAFDASALRETLHLRNVHDVNFATALALGRHLGTHLPTDERCHVVAVEIEHDLTFSENLTPGLKAALPELLREVTTHVLMLLAA